MKGGIGWKLIAFALDRDPWLSYLIFLFREIYIKLCQIYTKIHINSILYRHRRFKQIIFSEHATNLKTKISKRNLVVTWGFSNYYFIISIFIFLLISLLILFISLYYVARTPTNESAVILVTWYRQRHVTTILHYHWWEFWSCDLSLRFSKFCIYEFSYKFDTVL